VLGSVPKLKISPLPPTPSPAGRGWLEEPGEGVDQYKFLQIGIDISKKKLHLNIQKRLKKRLRMGMIREVENLHKQYGASWKRLENLGLEFRWIAQFLQHKISRQEMEAKLYFDIIHYAKRQITWFKKDPRIKWLKNYSQIEKLTKNFLK
jgi:tRNA dimethylallyltransferase